MLLDTVAEVTELAPGLNHAIGRGLDFLYVRQLGNGELMCYVSDDLRLQTWREPDSSVFVTAVVGNCLLALAGNARAEAIMDRAVPFVEYHMLRGGIWEFFTKRHFLHPYVPADIDDTACACVFLLGRQRDCPNPTNVPLLLANRNRKGVFYTWITLRPARTTNRTYWRVALTAALRQPYQLLHYWTRTECRPNDIDGVINANLLYYLGEHDYTQPVVEYLLAIVREGREASCDKWYHSPFAFYYAYSRNYAAGITALGEVRELSIARIVAAAQPSGQLGDTVLDTALGICALLDWQATPPELAAAVQFLLRSQGALGEWPGSIFFHSGPREILGWGSDELTTGFCLEALARYRRTVA
jgi:hypothetical protein